jgi:hypothetical protein
VLLLKDLCCFQINFTYVLNMMHKINSLFLSLQAGFNNVGSEQFLLSKRRIYKSNSYKLHVEKGLNMVLLMNERTAKQNYALSNVGRSLMTSRKL